MPQQQRFTHTNKTKRSLRKPFANNTKFPEAMVRDFLIAAYLGVAAWKTGRGSRDSLYVLVRVTYLSYFLCDMGFGKLGHRTYRETECQLETASEALHERGESRMCNEAVRLVAVIVAELDDQLTSTPASAFVEATHRVDEMISWICQVKAK